MGRKRTRTKIDLKLYVEEDVVEKLNFLKINKSVLFTEAALELINKIEAENRDKEED